MGEDILGPSIEAHRGASAVCPENSMAAFRRGVAAGVPSMELDVHETRDGAIVVMHDATVDRTTDGNGCIADLTLAEIRRLDCGSWKGAEFAGERVPTLEEVLALAAANECRLNVEIKAFQPSSRAPGKLAALLRAYPVPGGGHVVSSFDSEALLRMRDVDGGVLLAYLGAGLETVAVARELALPWVHLAWDSVDVDVMAAIRTAALNVMVWTLDDPAHLPRFAQLGVNKVCTNRPDLMLRACCGFREL